MTPATALSRQHVRKGQLLHHVSRQAYRGMALHFGCHRNRFDDPGGRFGVLYLGFDLATALMESVFHNHRWQRGPRLITRAEVNARMVRVVAALEDLALADLTAPAAMAADLGLNLAQLVSRRYQHTQRLACKLHQDRTLDGLLYPSRNNYPARCIALFDRAAAKVAVAADIDLARHTDWPAFCARYRIVQAP